MKHVTKWDLLTIASTLNYGLRFVWYYDTDGHTVLESSDRPNYATILYVELQKQCSCGVYSTLDYIGGILCQEGDMYTIGEVTLEEAINVNSDILAQHYQAQCCMKLLSDHLIREDML